MIEIILEERLCLFLIRIYERLCNFFLKDLKVLFMKGVLKELKVSLANVIGKIISSRRTRTRGVLIERAGAKSTRR